MKSGVNIGRLNIFIDETGEFGLGRRSAKFYGVSLVFHEHTTDISSQLQGLSRRFADLNFSGMVHMGDLINGHGEYENMGIKERKKIYSALFRFSSSVKMKYSSIIFQKRFADDVGKLANSLKLLLRNLIEENLAYFQQFNKIIVYYDGGQKILARIIDEEFGTLPSYVRKADFDHTEKKLFQVADMLTFLDKLIYKYEHRMKLSPSEKRFFNTKEILRVRYELRRKQLVKKAPFRVLI